MGVFEKLVEKALISSATKLTRYALNEVKKELRGQGHVLTGNLLKTAKADVEPTSDAITGRILMNSYFSYLERRLPAAKVPYTPGSGRKSSKVVAALERFWKLKGLSPKEAKSAAFATLRKWKKEGRPTAASYRFSKNGRRTGFLEHTVNQVAANGAGILSRGASNEIEKALAAAIRASIGSTVGR